MANYQSDSSVNVQTGTIVIWLITRDERRLRLRVLAAREKVIQPVCYTRMLPYNMSMISEWNWTSRSADRSKIEI